MGSIEYHADAVAHHSRWAIQNIRAYLSSDIGRQEGWSSAASGELKVSEKRFESRKSAGHGRCGKEMYNWLDIYYGGDQYSIRTWWEEVDTVNVHHYFGQFSFVKNISFSGSGCSSPNSPSTKVEELQKRAQNYEEFLNKLMHRSGAKYKTLRQRRDGIYFSVDSLHEGLITPEDIVSCFETWVEECG
ncbi:MAG: hypothetical protein FWE96_08530 [Coriobacteriia bacterium]|nr:hypothetical protein [Coriobacteriia bacterium]